MIEGWDSITLEEAFRELGGYIMSLKKLNEVVSNIQHLWVFQVLVDMCNLQRDTVIENLLSPYRT